MRIHLNIRLIGKEQRSPGEMERRFYARYLRNEYNHSHFYNHILWETVMS